MNGDFEKTEKLIQNAAERGLFQEYISSCAYKPFWTKLEPKNFGGKSILVTKGEKPSMRGGHQMCMDVTNQLIYIFGGWDGSKELSDFWSYHIADNKWECISSDTKRLLIFAKF